MTGWQGWQATGGRELVVGGTRQDADLAAYRDAVSDVLAELAGTGGALEPGTAERILSRRLRELEFGVIFSALPHGPDAAIQRVLGEVRAYRQSARNSAGNLAAMVRLALLSQIDLLWWGHLRPYAADSDVLSATELLQLEPLRQEGLLLFKYRLQAETLARRVVRSAARHSAPHHAPRTAGLRFPCARAELIVALNQIAAEFAWAAPRGTPRLWVTSLARSVAQQQHLRELGYAALLPSSHCVGYGADVEMDWFRRYGADDVLQSVLLERQRAGDINVVDEGQAWHICVRPGAGRALRLLPQELAGASASARALNSN